MLCGVLPQYARTAVGCARASVHETLKHVLAMGKDEVLIALMRKGNNVRGMFKVDNTAEIREYALYEMRP